MLLLGVLFICLTNPTVINSDATAACPRRCRATCGEPNPRNCRTVCSCKEQYHVYASRWNNTCIPTYQCPQNTGCNGDRNAVIQSPVLPNPSTCKQPNQGYSDPINAGCVCKSGYILSRRGGRCIPIDRCPGGNPCGTNQTLVSCSSCPYNPCPDSEEPVFYGCDPVWPCPSGCICKSEYKTNGGQCVLPQDCPPVTCTRVNEEWDRCPSPCYSDSCYDVPYRTAPCNTLVAVTCNPQCRCKPDYARADNGTCIPVEDCPPSP